MTPPLTGITPTTRPTRNVMNCGAIGDGIADDTAAIQKALTVTTGFVSVYFPRGTYKITSQITWDPYRVELRGDTATIHCEMKTPATYAIRVASSATAAPDLPRTTPVSPHPTWAKNRGIHFRSSNNSNGLTCGGSPGTANGTKTSWDIRPTLTAQVVLNAMVFQGFAVACRVTTGATALRFRDCLFTENSTAVLVDAADTALARTSVHGAHVSFNGCDFTKNAASSWMVEARGGQSVLLNNCSLTASAQLLYAGDTSVVSLVGCIVTNAGTVYPAGTSTATIQVDQSASLHLRHSTLKLNTAGTGTLTHAIQVASGAAASLDLCTVHTEKITALAAGGGRVRVTRTHPLALGGSGTTGSDALSTLLALNDQHNRLSGGVKNPTAWTRTTGVLTAPPTVAPTTGIMANRNVLKVAYTGTAESELSVTVPLADGTRQLGYRFDLIREGAPSTLTVKQVTVRFFAGVDAPTGPVLRKIVEKPGTALSSNAWSTITAGWNLDTLAQNSDLYRWATITLTVTGTTAGSVLAVSEAYVNAFG
ncbi:hypothetical protein GCM10022198_01890 [Klugiella xanthotipulae]|uniref:Pectate lyase-like protein n=1 Tax=Klugiella xanthotipulae TaxID=244735 RepID=A0A543I539_9MICO|nr:glycosyl hydrolase family 28-related protein [Klugiella xanthotipulae]TQM65674.1 pectate lyase-like protein [Klugiella xanthotipulae]